VTKEEINDPTSFEQCLTKQLIPSILMQYNLRQQLQSQSILSDFQGVNEEEIEKLEDQLMEASEKQKAI
jgi:hypothetical protein